MFDGPVGEFEENEVLGAPLAVAVADQSRFLGFGRVIHLGRERRCGFHLVLHGDASGPDGVWTHLYRTVATRGGGRLVLLCRAAPGDARALLAAACRRR